MRARLATRRGGLHRVGPGKTNEGVEPSSAASIAAHAVRTAQERIVRVRFDPSNGQLTSVTPHRALQCCCAR